MWYFYLFELSLIIMTVFFLFHQVFNNFHDMDHHFLLEVFANHLNTKRTSHGSSGSVPGNSVAEVVAYRVVEGIGVKSCVILCSHLGHGQNT